MPSGGTCCYFTPEDSGYTFGIVVGCKPGYRCGTAKGQRCICNGIERADGTCGACPSGEFQCGKKCCKGKRPTLPAEVCYRGQCRPGCPDGTKKCGTTCCTKKQGCKNGKCCDKCGGSGKCCNHATEFCCREPGNANAKGPGRCCKKDKESCCRLGPPDSKNWTCCAEPNECVRELPPTIGGLTASSLRVCCPPERQVPEDENHPTVNACCAPGQVSLGGKLLVGSGVQGHCCNAAQICGSGKNITCCQTFSEAIGTDLNETCCSGVCFQLQYSDQNCGACGKACPGGQRCQKGVCVPR
jgi:hypothetical protein